MSISQSGSITFGTESAHGQLDSLRVPGVAGGGVYEWECGGVSRPIHWGEMRAALSEAQNHRCAYCGVEMLLTTPAGSLERPWDIATVDHIEPRSCGGGDDWHNLVMACRACNEMRESMGVWQFLELVRRWIKRGGQQPSRDVYGFSGFVRAFMAAKLARRIEARRAVSE